MAFGPRARVEMIVGAFWLTFALLLTPFGEALADAELDNGAQCHTHGECRSRTCAPFPDKRHYCRAQDMDCAEPDSDGLPSGFTATVYGRTWMCRKGASWRASAKLANGDECHGDSQCASARCDSNPDGHRYCVAQPLGCSDPRMNGVESGYTMQIIHKSWTCTRGKGWEPAKFSDFKDAVGKYRNCLPRACEAGDTTCKAREKSESLRCERLKSVEIELAEPVSLAIANGRDAAIRAGVHGIPGAIRSRLEDFFASAILDEVRYRIGTPGDSELLKFAFEWLRTSAFVMGHVIIFKDEQDALHNVRLWAHELEHVIQYDALGIDGFAQRWIQAAKRGGYDEDKTTIEGAATARAIYVCSYIRC